MTVLKMIAQKISLDKDYESKFKYLAYQMGIKIPFGTV
jgi:hypothetical protein